MTITRQTHINLKMFFELAFERHRIYVKRQLGLPKPWTLDRVFRNVYFCNVFRTLDKTSVWIKENVNDVYGHEPDFWKSVILTRILSRIETLEILKEENCLYGDLDKAIKVLKDIQRRGEQVFTGAFVINAKKFGNRIDYIKWLIEAIDLELVDANRVMKEYRLSELHKLLKSFHSIGDFMAYEYVTDFSYTFKKDCPDVHNWLVLGLGAKRGFNRIFGRLYDDGIPIRDVPENYMAWCLNIRDAWNKYVDKHLKREIEKTSMVATSELAKTQIYVCYEAVRQEVEFLYEPFKNITMREVEHWLCEYDKYNRSHSKHKRKYNGN